jgi:hypothetical protein
MGIKQICNTIKNYFNKTRSPFPEFPGLLIVCSMGKRPGLSTIQSTSNIVTDLAKLGIPTGTMPEGCPNMSIGYTYAQTKEIFRAIKKDAHSQIAFQPGSINFVVTGPVMGGATGTNINTGKICATAN